MMQILYSISICAALVTTGASGLIAQDCSDALVASTYRLQSTDNRDFRLVSFVTEKQYEDAKHGGNTNVLIYDVPVGADYSDFQCRSREMTNKLKLRITHEQAIALCGQESLRGDSKHIASASIASSPLTVSTWP